MAYKMKGGIVRMPNTLRQSFREKETRLSGKKKGMTPPGLKSHVIKF